MQAIIDTTPNMVDVTKSEEKPINNHFSQPKLKLIEQTFEDVKKTINNYSF
jgi:hypothetical protein